MADTAQTMAGDVTDKASLKAFVLSAKTHLEIDYDKALVDFTTKEEWKKDAIYLYVISLQGTSLFNPVTPEIVGKNLNTIDPARAKLVTDPILAAAVKEGGDFVEYEWDNPLVEGEDKSLKIAYVITFEKDGQKYVVGSGFYKTVESTQ